MLGALPLVISDINKVMENEAHAGRQYKFSDAFFNMWTIDNAWRQGLKYLQTYDICCLFLMNEHYKSFFTHFSECIYR